MWVNRFIEAKASWRYKNALLRWLRRLRLKLCRKCCEGVKSRLCYEHCHCKEERLWAHY